MYSEFARTPICIFMTAVRVCAVVFDRQDVCRLPVARLYVIMYSKNKLFSMCVFKFYAVILYVP